jgi:hypothetical protein
MAALKEKAPTGGPKAMPSTSALADYSYSAVFPDPPQALILREKSGNDVENT